MKIALISIHYSPLKSSCAVQMSHLAEEILKQGHCPVIFTPDSNISKSFITEEINNIKVVRLKSLKLLNINNFLRALSELIMPYMMIKGAKKTQIDFSQFDGVIWYSPSIFFAPFVTFISKKSCCKSYLILRDIFPEWALDLKLIKKGFVYYFFKLIANHQYKIADKIGIQTESNQIYFSKENKKIEVLNNWISKRKIQSCSINLLNTNLSQKKIIIYIGNMGIAQGFDFILDSLELFDKNKEIGFLFVGRGTMVNKIKLFIKIKDLSNVIIKDEIHPDEISELLKQGHLGLVSLDSRHKSHNIPGKFLSYLESGLPTLAKINENTDLKKIIKKEMVGEVYTGNSVEEFVKMTNDLLSSEELLKKYSKNSIELVNKKFKAEIAVQQILRIFKNEK